MMPWGGGPLHETAFTAEVFGLLDAATSKYREKQHKESLDKMKKQSGASSGAKRPMR